MGQETRQGTRGPQKSVGAQGVARSIARKGKGRGREGIREGLNELEQWEGGR